MRIAEESEVVLVSEASVAKKIGAKKVKNSGRGLRKGDMIKGRVVFDLKEVERSFSLNKSVWAKVCTDASTYGWEYVPVLLVEFKDGMRLVVMDYDDWEEGWQIRGIS
jgi:hypothetical protein